jgi:L-rhamnose isomerase
MPRRSKSSIGLEVARERYAAVDVDVEEALAQFRGISISLQCWQGDDVQGFETNSNPLSGGIAVTGNYIGRARTPDELRADFETALRLIPGTHRFSLHASYGEFGGRKIDRDQIETKHFAGWIEWARQLGIGLDFNQTCFAHPRAADGFTLSHRDAAIRDFWIEHCRRAREIGAAFGKALSQTCVTNLWVPDGFKDTPADRKGARERLLESLDAVFKRTLPAKYNLDAVEGKLFGIGAESCTVGSHEFYLGYAITRKKLLCLDAGHFHPTETISDKISSVLQFLPEILLHVSRGVRWDSDHVVTLTDELQAIAREIIANDYADRVRIGLDYFDASINRIAAWVIGARNVLRALLIALLEPPAIVVAERVGDNTARLALQEEARALPFGAVWDEYCARNDVPVGEAWLREVRDYEERVLSKRI